VIHFDELWHVDVLYWFPGVIGVWVALPLYKILELAPTPMEPLIHDGLHLELLLSSNQLGRRSGEVGSIRSRFLISGQQGHMENIMDTPRDGELQLKRNWGNDLLDTEWS